MTVTMCYALEWDYFNMAQGLQCWNASGTLIVDLQDYNLRFVGSATYTLGGTYQWNIGYGGMTANGWIVYPQDGRGWQNYVVRCYDGGFIVTFAPLSTPPTQTITFDIWTYN